jgi:hypothetical protein
MKRIIFHCSDSSYGNAAEITKWHIDRKFNTIGYNYVVLNGWTAKGYYDRDFDGHIETGRNPEIEGAHCSGNNDALGVCLIGKGKLYTNKQLEAVDTLLMKLKMQYEEIKIYQHSDFDTNKWYCAGLDLTKWRKEYE